MHKGLKLAFSEVDPQDLCLGTDWIAMLLPAVCSMPAVAQFLFCILKHIVSQHGLDQLLFKSICTR